MDLNVLGLFLWIVFPYSTIVVFMMGVIWKYNYVEDQSKRSAELHPVSCISMIFILISNVILIVLLIFSQGFQWMVWYGGFLTFRPDIDAILETTVLFQLQILLFFSFILLLPFSPYMSIFSLTWKKWKKLRKQVRKRIAAFSG